MERRETKSEPGFCSILDFRKSPHKEEQQPAFFDDLNLHQIIDRIRKDWGENISSFFYYLPADTECEDYRREVFADVKRGNVYESLCAFYKKMKTRREIFFKKEEVSLGLQKAVWHIHEAGCYCEAFSELFHRLESEQLQSAGMKDFCDYLKQVLSTESFQEMHRESRQLQEQLESIRLVLTYENDRIAVAVGEVEGAYDRFLERCNPREESSLSRKGNVVPWEGNSLPREGNSLPREGNFLPREGNSLPLEYMKSPYESEKELTMLEQEIMKICQKLYPDFFRQMKEFYKKYEIYASEKLTTFASEIGYYLSFYRFEQRMKERGYAFAEPRMLEVCEDDMSAVGLYDLALACAACEDGRQVVSNDMILKKEECFYVLTGPNQGGKTTFARSLGQLVFFARMGLDVPAAAAKLYRFTEILTHFSVEESVETGRGKLMEELERLAPMMDAVRKPGSDAFVVINELFTTAANYDACIMGKRVLEYFLAQGCRGIYVTHLKELSQVHPKIVSLRAMLDEQGRHTFQIARGEAADSASAADLVKKHGLTYDQLKERLAGVHTL